MGGFEYRESPDRDPAYWREVEEWVDERIRIADLATFALFNRIIAKTHGETENDEQTPRTTRSDSLDI